MSDQQIHDVIEAENEKLKSILRERRGELIKLERHFKANQEMLYGLKRRLGLHVQKKPSKIQDNPKEQELEG